MDRLSTLPESLLHHIMSLLPIKDSIRTCLLSISWKHHWISLQNLDFKCTKRDPGFLSFVESVLRRHSSNVNVFRLHYTGDVENSFISFLLTNAVNRHVQVLDLCLSADKLVLPLHSLNTLRELRIEMSCDLLLPELVVFSSLKTLSLDRVIFSDDLSFDKLFTGLPVLEELSLSSCKWFNLRKATIIITTLRKLTIDLLAGLWDWDKYEESKDECRIQVYAKNLVYFSCTSALRMDLTMDNSPLLDHAVISICNYYQEGIKQYAKKLLNGILSAKSLTVTEKSLRDLCSFVEEDADFLPTFSNLTSVEVPECLYSEAIIGSMSLFRNSPRLESFSTMTLWEERVTWRRELVPKCGLSEFCRREAEESSFMKFVINHSLGFQYDKKRLLKRLS